MTMIRALAVIFAATFAAGAVRAEVIGTAQIDWATFSYQILDLDLGDGIAPTLSFDALTEQTLVRVVAPGGPPLEQSAGDWSTPLSVSLSAAGGTLLASADQELLAQSDGFVLGGMAEALAERSVQFTSTGKSVVVFSVDYTVSVGGLSPGQSFSALAGLGWDAIDPFGVVGTAREEFALTDTNGTSPAGARLSVAFVNLTGAETVGTVYGTASVTSVPEPQAYLMLGAGAVLLALRLRRGRRRAP